MIIFARTGYVLAKLSQSDMNFQQKRRNFFTTNGHHTRQENLEKIVDYVHVHGNCELIA